MENVPTFHYMGRPLYQTDNDRPDVQQNIMRAWSFCKRLGTLLLRERVDHKVSESFYREVVQAAGTHYARI